MTLAEFLLARIAEDEAVAQRAASIILEDRRGTRYGIVHEPGSLPLVATSPARVLAECEAKRRIVERENSYGPANGFPMVTAMLAAVYADHPDYREEWKPWSPRTT